MIEEVKKVELTITEILFLLNMESFNKETMFDNYIWVDIKEKLRPFIKPFKYTQVPEWQEEE